MIIALHGAEYFFSTEEQFLARDYTGYMALAWIEEENDHTKPYTTFIGCKVTTANEIPEGMSSIIIGGGDYAVSSVRGNLSEGFVVKEWMRIWNSDLDRAYTADFEVYTPSEKDITNLEVGFYIAVN